jgi:hypothetical protein
MPLARSRATTARLDAEAEGNGMTFNLDLLLHSRSTDSDVRCSLLLAAVRAFQGVAPGADRAARENALLAEFAEPVVLPDALRGR